MFCSLRNQGNSEQNRIAVFLIERFHMTAKFLFMSTSTTVLNVIPHRTDIPYFLAPRQIFKLWMFLHLGLFAAARNPHVSHINLFDK